MIYQAKQDSPAYNFIKETLEKENQEFEAYKKRVEDALGFEAQSFNGYHPNHHLMRRWLFVAVNIDPSRLSDIDTKAWKVQRSSDKTVTIVPNKRTKAGKAVEKILDSYNNVSSHWGVHEKLGVKEPQSEGKFSITELYFRNGHAFVCFDDRCRADKQNEDLKEVTVSEFEVLTDYFCS